jgi:exocyst complex component 1
MVSDFRQLVSVLGILEKQISEWEETDQKFIIRTLNKQHDKLGGAFHRFVEEQVRAIEDMKVTAKKRQGVLLMFRTFPVLACLAKLILGVRGKDRDAV